MYAFFPHTVTRIRVTVRRAPFHMCGVACVLLLGESQRQVIASRTRWKMSSYEYMGRWLLQEMLEDDLEDQLKVAIILGLQKQMRKKRKHRFWVHDILKKREHQGAYNHLVQEIAMDPDKFHEYFRMSEQQFEEY